mmetsp:Transcript_30587/g.61670  ORF Transcript_30587/g.61670 Transcript_30587/m.61670 type:complete len:156 (-) Transcript_30587:293-760(-)
MERVRATARNDEGISLRKLAACAAVLALALCATIVVVNSSSSSEELLEEQDSIKHVLPPHYKQTLHEVKTMARAMKLDEAADQVNAQAIKAAFEPFLNDPDEEIVAQTKQFDADEKAKAVQKYSDDITAILKGVEAEAKLLKSFTKAELPPKRGK